MNGCLELVLINYSSKVFLLRKRLWILVNLLYIQYVNDIIKISSAHRSQMPNILLYE